MIYDEKKIQIKNSQRKKHIEYAPGQVLNSQLPLSSPHRVMNSIVFLALMCDNVLTEYCPTRKALAPWYPESVLGSVTWALLTGLMGDLFSSTQGGKLISMIQRHPKSSCYYLAGPKPPGKQNYSIQK